MKFTHVRKTLIKMFQHFSWKFRTIYVPRINHDTVGYTSTLSISPRKKTVISKLKQPVIKKSISRRALNFEIKNKSRGITD